MLFLVLLAVSAGKSGCMARISLCRKATVLGRGLCSVDIVSLFLFIFLRVY